MKSLIETHPDVIARREKDRIRQEAQKARRERVRTAADEYEAARVQWRQDCATASANNTPPPPEPAPPAINPADIDPMRDAIDREKMADEYKRILRDIAPVIIEQAVAIEPELQQTIVDLADQLETAVRQYDRLRDEVRTVRRAATGLMADNRNLTVDEAVRAAREGRSLLGPPLTPPPGAVTVTPQPAFSNLGPRPEEPPRVSRTRGRL